MRQWISQTLFAPLSIVNRMVYVMHVCGDIGSRSRTNYGFNPQNYTFDETIVDFNSQGIVSFLLSTIH